MSAKSMQFDFTHKRVAVVGAARGIGQELIRAFAVAGAEVWACDILLDELQGRVRQSDLASATVYCLHTDVTDETSVRSTVGTITAKAQRSLDVLVYVAGGVCGQSPKPLEQVTLAEWRSIVDVNLQGAFLACREVLPRMKEQGGGRIIIISSGAGLHPSFTGIQSYCAAKHGQVGLVRQLAQELTSFNITVNAIAPGFMTTNPDTARQWSGYSDEFRRDFLKHRVLQRTGTPEDVAYATLFLASDYAAWITGQVLPVTGCP